MNPWIRAFEYLCCALLTWRTKDLLLELIRRLSQAAKDHVMPVHLPPPGSLWIQRAPGLSWGTTGYYDGETNPFSKFPGTFNVWFRPGSKWLVINSSKADVDDYYWIDLIQIGEERRTRIFGNRYSMRDWNPKSGNMQRIDADV